MKLLRNPEISKSLCMYLAMDIVVSVAGFFLFGTKGFIVLLMVGLLFTIWHIVDVTARYRRFETLAKELEDVLYGKTALISSYKEGEISILQSQISKLLVRLKEQTEQLQEDKEYLKDSLADISHQLRTPLTSIHLIVDMLKESNLEEDRKRQLLFDLSRQLERMEWQIEMLLKLAKLDAGTAYFKNEEINIKELLRKAGQAIAIPMELRQQSFLLKADGNETFMGDFDWTYEAVANILKNCMEHTPTEGQIQVSVTTNQLYREIIIEDNGNGISDEDIHHLFERFYKGENATKESVGIGLALAKKIILKQHGTIKAENRAEGGARFIIRLYCQETI